MSTKPARNGPKISVAKPANKLKTNEEYEIRHIDNADIQNLVHTCQFCLQKFDQNINYFRHMSTNHQIQQKDAIYECDNCNVVFTKKNSLDNHCRTKHQVKSKSKCQLCEVTFKSRYCLRRHLKLKQLMQKNTCLKCQKKFVSQEGLLKHVRNKHTSKNVVHICKVCSHNFKARGSLLIHMNRIHKKL